MNSHSLPGDKMGDFCDSKSYKDSELFQVDPCALQIQLYYDEVEVCNPIGSKAKIHKLGKQSKKIIPLYFAYAYIIIIHLVPRIGLLFSR